MKKILCGLLAGCIMLGCASCGDTGTQGTGATGGTLKESAGGLELPLSKKGETITWLESSSIDNLNNMFAIETLREETGIDLQVQVFPPATVQEKTRAMIAAKNLPDVISAGFSDNEEINDLAVQGAFTSVDDKLDIMPNFKQLFYDDPENKWVFSSYQASDGHLYVIPNYGINREVNHGMLYRKDIFDKHNIKAWTNQEEFYASLKKLKELYPSSTPFTSKNGINLLSYLAVSWGIGYNGPYYDEGAGVWNYSDTDPQMKNMLDFLRKLLDEGLMDKEFLTLTQAAWTSKMTQEDKAFTTFDWIGRLESFTEQSKTVVPGYDLRYGYPIGPKGTIVTLPMVTGGLAVSKNAKSDLALKLCDFLLSPAGAEVMTLGKENVTYTLGENGKANYIEYQGVNPDIKDLEAKYGMFSAGMTKRFDRRSCYYNFSQREQEAQEFANKDNVMEPADPILRFTPEQKKLITDKLPGLKKAAQEFFSNYLIGKQTGEAAWNAWVAKAKTLGAEEITQTYNEAQKTYVK